MVRSRLLPVAVLLGIATTGVSGCTSDDGDPAPSASGSTDPTSSAAVPEPTPTVAEELPVVPDDGYADAVAAFGAEQVSAAVENAARVAHIALADCHRWTTGEVDPRLPGLVTPELLARSLAELDRTPEYGGVPFPSLLSHLPTDDGNGNDEAAAVTDGCNGSAPLRYDSRPLTVSVDRSGAEPRLRLTGGFAAELTLGVLRVGAGQDWTFTSTSTADGWRVSDASVDANVNWYPTTPA